ncbi:hypothetical protein CXB51_008450 [Gossypium anomalum]|uniref:Exostosin GT47 domain-containing protein n=1 Tax=Gossypium anomalum TaxID=47600 RepID=A0A8J5Z954_9ROSI|nr:hypothetical protein CXB51_008450 [Gossypium anomalum]
MRAKQIPSSLTRSKSQILLLFFSLSLILLSYLFFLFPPSDPAASSTTNPYPQPRIPPQTSFLASLELFLTHKALNHRSSDDTVRSLLQDDVRMFDDRKFAKEMDWVYGDPYYPLNFPIRVYVYQMPNKFTYDLLWLFRKTYRETSNLTSSGSPVHRLIEQHSIDYWLWADLIAPESERLLKNVVRVDRQEEADLFYVPFFTTISFFLLEKQQCKALYREALKWVTEQPAWKRSEGRDHIFPIHHPWSFKSVRRYIWIPQGIAISFNILGTSQGKFHWRRTSFSHILNVDLCDAKCVSESESKRPILFFFRGQLKRNAFCFFRGGKIRSKLVTELAGAKDVVIEEGTSGDQGKAAAQKGMRRSIFCLSPAGDTPSSARLFDAIVSGCLHVIISDELELPFEGILDYRKIAIFVSSTDAVQPGWLLPFLKGISSTQIREMRRNLVEFSRHFMYSSPSQPLGPEDLVWRMMGGKLVNIKLHTRRLQRVVKESRSVCTCDCRSGNNTTSSTLSGQSLSG